MNKLICLECGYVASINYFGYIDNDDPDLAPEYRRSYYCPMCGSVFVDDADYCEVCKQYFPKEVIKDNACPDCRKFNEEKELN